MMYISALPFPIYQGATMTINLPKGFLDTLSPKVKKELLEKAREFKVDVYSIKLSPCYDSINERKYTVQKETQYLHFSEVANIDRDGQINKQFYDALEKAKLVESLKSNLQVLQEIIK